MLIWALSKNFVPVIICIPVVLTYVLSLKIFEILLVKLDPVNAKFELIVDKLEARFDPVNARFEVMVDKLESKFVPVVVRFALVVESAVESELTFELVVDKLATEANAPVCAVVTNDPVFALSA